MSRRRATLVTCGLVLAFLAMYIPATAVFEPASSPVQAVDARPPPTSTMVSLPKFSRQVVTVNYTSNGTAGQSGVFWTELWYSRNDGPWVQYRPPWNPTGQYPGVPLNNPMFVSVGTILFDTFFTGGDARYNFTTVAVDRGFFREVGPPESAAHAKAKTMVDSIPPNIFIARPTPGAWTNSGNLTWAAQDAVSGIASVDVSLDGGAPQSFAQAAGSWDLSLGSAGNHTVVISAVDGAGNRNTVHDPFHYDPNAPTLQITSPTSNSYVSTADVPVSWTLGHDLSGIASLRLQVDANAPVSLPANATSYDLANLAESGHVVSLLATDNAGNFASQIVGFGVDATPPTLALVSPAPGSFVAAHQVQALWSGSDAGSGIDSYRVSIDGGTPTTVTNAAGFVFPNVAEGTHTVLVQAVDRAGNQAQASAQVTVDVTPPDLSIAYPTPGAKVSGSASVNWSASDSGSGVAQVFVVVDGEPAIGVAPASVAQPVSPLTLGIHSVTVRVYDRAGNMAEKTVAFDYVGSVPPSGSGIPSLDFWIIMAIIGAIAVGSAYYAVRRRRKSQS